MRGTFLQAPVDSVMIRSCLCTIRPDAAITEAAEKLCQQGSSGLVVFDGTPLGLITADHMIQTLADLQNPETTRVADIMSSAPIPAVDIGSTLGRVLTTMLEHHVQAVAVREGEKLAGLITLPRVLPFIVAQAGELGSVEAR